MRAFGPTIFTGAFLLFLVQPLVARFILPWFGGSPAVWTTCMLFFQVLLLGGYAYADLSIRLLKPRRQVILHLVLLVAALLLLPITPGEQWKPVDDAAPTLRILLLLLVCLGLPYFVLSATGPLMQAWFSHAHPGRAPYRLYALSNIGSLLALVGYPFLVEPSLSRQAQAAWWSVGLGAFAMMAFWCGTIVWKRAAEAGASRQGGGADHATAERDAIAPTMAKAGWLWFLLPACASVLLLAVTNKVCQDVAVVPFLWVAPLSLYLLTFIVSFDSPRWYQRGIWMPLLALALGGVVFLMLARTSLAGDEDLPWRLGSLLEHGDNPSLLLFGSVHLGFLFVGGMVCHGELYRLRPVPRKLTGFYLMIAAGGAAGGLFVALLAPWMFEDYFEWHFGLLAVAVLAIVVLVIDRRSPLRRVRHAWLWVVPVAAVAGLGLAIRHDVHYSKIAVVERSRSFYGVLKVEEYFEDDPEEHELRLTHGGTTHGVQFPAPHLRGKPTTYYTAGSGLGLTFEHFPRTEDRRVGVIGLGTGTVVAWGRAGDSFRIYEINREVHRLALERFFYLADTPAEVDVVIGDARLSMEHEPDQRFDILVLDAFSSDSIPVHLLTLEAFGIYQRHLHPDGVIAVHISNRHLDLEPVVRRLAEDSGYQAAVINDSEGDRGNGEDRVEWDGLFEDEDADDWADIPGYGSDWVLVTRNTAFLELDEIRDACSAPGGPATGTGIWTDERSNLFEVLILKEGSWLARLRGWMLGTR